MMRRGWAAVAAVLMAGAAWAGPAKVKPKDFKKTASGLQYAVLKRGKGPGAREGQRVFVHYTGWLQDGKKFDSSRDRDEAFEFPLGSGQVIAGWDEGVVGMSSGELRQLVIPPKLAYGDRGVGAIPPGSTLIFEVEVIKLGDVVETNAKPAAVAKDALKKTESGLQYAILKEGDGKEAMTGQQVTNHYTGWLESGKKFDSSLDRGEPFKFPLGAGRVIKGWDEGVRGMKVGEKRQLLIPAALGYGDRGAGGVIPPGAALIFEVQLLGVDG